MVPCYTIIRICLKIHTTTRSLPTIYLTKRGPLNLQSCGLYVFCVSKDKRSGMARFMFKLDSPMVVLKFQLRQVIFFIGHSQFILSVFQRCVQPKLSKELESMVKLGISQSNFLQSYLF